MSSDVFRSSTLCELLDGNLLGEDDEYLRVFLQVGEGCNESCTIGDGELESCPCRSYVVRREIVREPNVVSVQLGPGETLQEGSPSHNSRRTWEDTCRLESAIWLMVWIYHITYLLQRRKFRHNAQGAS